jgi:hypothetical protein|nr:MAG TPA: hypothetical protein [Bacteriophage sp.]
MDYIEKLFKQYPFIYFIGGKYYAFGSYVCSECDMRSVTLESRYKEFEDSIKEELTQKEAWKIFHKLIFKAECVRDEHGFCTEPQKELLKLQFSDSEMDELKFQVNRYVEYWKKYSFADFC